MTANRVNDNHSEMVNLGADDHTQYLLINGSRAMSGNLDMGTNDVTNVGLVDGVDVSALSSAFSTHAGGTAISQHTGGLGDHSHQSAGAQGGQLDHGLAMTPGSLTDDDHTQYVLVNGTRAMTGTLTINPADNTSAIVASGVASTAGAKYGIDFSYNITGNFAGVRTFRDASTINTETFSFSLFEIAPTFAATVAGGGVFSFLTAIIFSPTINTATGTLKNLTGFYYLPTFTAGSVTTAYGVFIQSSAGVPSTEVGGHFEGATAALQVGTGAISAPTINGRWFQDGDMVLGGTAMSGTERLRVVGDARVESSLIMPGGSGNWLQVPQMTTGQRNTMTAAWGAADAGKEWFNTTLGQGEAWNGVAIVTRY